MRLNITIAHDGFNPHDGFIGSMFIVDATKTLPGCRQAVSHVV